MGAADQVEVVALEELREHIFTKKETDAPLQVLLPAALLLHRVRPQQVTEHAVGGDIGGTVEGDNFFDFGEFGTDAAVHAEDAFLDEGGEGHAVEGVHEVLPDLEGVLALAWVGRGVHSS